MYVSLCPAPSIGAADGKKCADCLPASGWRVSARSGLIIARFGNAQDTRDTRIFFGFVS